MKLLALVILALLLVGPAWGRDSEKTIFSNSYSITPSPSPTVPPAPSTGLAAPAPLKASTSLNKVVLSWTNIISETGYIVERRRSGTTQFTEVAKTTADSSTHTDILTDTTNKYEYRVRAYSAVGQMSYSPYTNTAFSTIECE